MSNNVEPLISASKNLPEITVKAVVLSIILTAVLAAANAFLGLKVGATVSASIPAAVISLGILRLFRRHNVLESTMVQTAASVGEGLTAGLAFILPALLVLGFWHDFSYWVTFSIGLLGGLLGILYTIPIRRALINSPELTYPEGTAIGNVLKASASKESADLSMLVKGGVVGAVITLFQTGFRIFSDSAEFWWKLKGSLFGIGVGFSPALIAAGYIVGVNVGLSILLGIVIGWVIGVPVLANIYGLPDVANPVSAAHYLWSEHIRYVGVGAMLVGGLWTLIKLSAPVAVSLKSSWKAMRAARLGNAGIVPRTEKDIPLIAVLWMLVAVMVPTFIFIYMMLHPALIPVSPLLRLVIAVISVIYLIIAGFIFSSIAAYFAGLIGSTNSPGSGLTVSVLLLFSLIMLVVMSIDLEFIGKVTSAELSAAGFSIVVVALVSASIVIANETMQDLKVGQILGATPWKQQVMLIIGVLVAAAVIPLILSLLFNAYGMAGVFPREGMEPSQMLAAPQAGLMAAIAKGAFTHHLPWAMIIAGGVIAIFCIGIDENLKKYNTRLPVLAVGVGIYLPFGASIPMVLGGIIQFFVNKKFAKLRQQGKDKEVLDEQIAKNKHYGLTLACGLVAGSSLMGVALAVPFAIEKSSDALALVGPEFVPIAHALAGVTTLLLCSWMFVRITRLR